MRTWLSLVAAALALTACFGADDNELDCDPAPVLAASSAFTSATTCAAEISYEGDVHPVGCADVHPSRVGRVFEHGSGETEYRGARRIRGIPRERLFILLGPGCGRGRTHVAHGDGVTDADFRLAASPLGRSSEKESRR